MPDLRAALVGALLAGCAPKQGPVLYATVHDAAGEQALTLDVVVPDGPGPHPGVVILHAGGWRGGHLTEWDIPEQMAALADAGFVVATVEYRLTDERAADGGVRWPWPAAISDARCAVRWLRAHAGELSLDPDRIGATGWSAGGHLALLLAVAPHAPDLDDGQCPVGGSAAVQAAAARAGPADLVGMTGATLDPGRDMLAALLDLPAGADPREDAATFAVASPLHRLTDVRPPVLQQQGADDRIVPPELARRLDARLTERGHRARLIEYAGVGHLFLGETAERVRGEEVAFFVRELGD